MMWMMMRGHKDRTTSLASGHPDLRESKPVLLGLIESRDAGQTWEPLSMEGRSDSHALLVFLPQQPVPAPQLP